MFITRQLVFQENAGKHFSTSKNFKTTTGVVVMAISSFKYDELCH